MALTTKWLKLRDLMDEMTPATMALMVMNATVTIAGTSQTVNIITVPDVQRDFMLMHGDRVFLDPYWQDENETMAIAAVRLQGIFTVWANRRNASYGRIYQALAEEALTDPTENYDRKEDGGWKDTHDLGEKVRDTSLKHEIGERVRDTEYKPNTINTVENYTAGDDVSTPVIESKSVSTPSGLKDEGKTTDKKATDEDTGKITDKKATDTDTRLFQNYRVHGNIGVSTAADMAEKILDLHMRADLTQQALNEFVDLYTIYR